MCSFCQAEDGIRAANWGPEFRRVLFRSPPVPRALEASRPDAELPGLRPGLSRGVVPPAVLRIVERPALRDQRSAQVGAGMASRREAAAGYVPSVAVDVADLEIGRAHV